MPFTIAVDFDSTIALPNWPDIGQEIPGAIDTLKHFQERGCKLILWTCRSKRSGLQEAVWWCQERGLTFDAVNANADDMGPVAVEKVWANFYIDDSSYDWVVQSGNGPFTPERWKEIRMVVDVLLDNFKEKGA